MAGTRSSGLLRHACSQQWCSYSVQLKCCFTSTETVGLIGTGTQDVHLDFDTAPELCKCAASSGIVIVCSLRSALRVSK